MSKATFILLITLLIVVYSNFPTEARGGRGGGFRGGGYRGGGYRSSSRTRVRVRYSNRVPRNMVNNRYSYRASVRYRTASRSDKLWLISSGAVFISLHHRPHYGPRYYGSSSREMEICYNNFDKPFKNATAPYGLFMCPLDRDFSKVYCCGPVARQYCCKYFDDPGKLAGLIIGLLITAIIIGVILYCCCCKRTNKSPVMTDVTYTVNYQNVPAKDMNYPNLAPPTYPAQPNAAPPYNPNYPGNAAYPNSTPGYSAMPDPNASGYPGGYPPATGGYPPSSNNSTGYAGASPAYGLAPAGPDYSSGGGGGGMPQPSYDSNPPPPNYNAAINPSYPSAGGPPPYPT